MTSVQNLEIKELDPDIIPPVTARMNDPEYGGSKIVIVGKPGTGKCLAAGTPVILYNGTIKNVEDIVVGDILMGDDSTPRNVLSICSGTDVMYKIYQKNGDNYTVNSPHILSLTNKTKEILDIPVTEFLAKDKTFRTQYRGYKVSVEFEEKTIYEHPYNFGKKLDDTNQINIPLEYKANTKYTRLNLLAGIIDSCAFYEENNDCYEITKDNKEILQDITFVARSLGFAVTTIYNNFDINTTSKSYTIKIFGNIKTIPTKVMRSTKIKQKPANLTTEISIKELGVGKYYGFQLDGNHRFLLGDFTVTHNTTLIKSLMYAKKHIFPVAMVMNGSEDSNFAYAGQNNDGFIPSSFVFNEYDEEKIKDFIKRQKIAKKHLENPWAILLIDDCTDDIKLMNKPIQHTLFKRGRHFKCLYLLSLQYAMDVKPVIRTNCDGIFILREPILKNRKSLWMNYASIIPDFELFCTLLDKLTEDHHAMYIQNIAGTNRWQDVVYFYKAKLLPEWKFGSDIYWDHHNQRYNPEYVDPITA